VPNPESALNEEAGKLLLERYDDYCARAKLYTEIHAKSELSEKKSAANHGEMKSREKKDKKRTLKRL